MLFNEIIGQVHSKALIKRRDQLRRALIQRDADSPPA
jgi:hypothetical protein